MELVNKYKRQFAAVAGVGGAVYLAYRYLMDEDEEEYELPLPRRDTKNNPSISINAMKNKQTLEDVDWKGKRVLMRVDYNVKYDVSLLELERMSLC